VSHPRRVQYNTSKEQVFISQKRTSIIDVYFFEGHKVTTCFGLYYQAITRSQETEI